MNWADWVIVVLLALSCVLSLARGFIKEAFSLVIWLLALVVANLFSHRLEPVLAGLIATPSLRAISAFMLLFIAVLLIGALLNYCLGLIVKASGLSGTDRLLGLMFGMVRGLFVVLLVLIYVPKYVPIDQDAWFRESQLIPYFLPYEQPVKNAIDHSSHWFLGLLNEP